MCVCMRVRVRACTCEGNEGALLLGPAYFDMLYNRFRSWEFPTVFVSV